MRLNQALIIGIVLCVLVGLSTFLIFSLFSTQISSLNVDEKKGADAIYQECRKRKKRDNCYIKVFSAYAQKNPLDKSTAVLQSLKEIDSSTVFCHGIAHEIANVEVAKNPDNWLNLLAEVDVNDCSRGYFHGAIEGYSAYHPDFALTEKSIPTVCDQAASVTETKIKRENGELICIHAIGHMLLVQEEANIETSISICHKIPEHQRFECYSGVFMENMNKENLLTHGIVSGDISWNRENMKKQEALCIRYNDSGETATACWRALGEMYGGVVRDRYELHLLCGRANILRDREQCEMNGISFMAFSNARNGQSEKVENICNSFAYDKSKLDLCTQAVIEYLLNLSPTYLTAAISYCDSLSVTTSQDYCYRILVNKLTQVQVEKDAYCDMLPKSYKNICLTTKS